jgi:aspartate kinase
LSVKKRIIVQKFGGSSVGTIEKLRKVAELVAAKKRAGFSVVVVVSAMGDTTDELLEKAKQISKEPDRRELDMLLSAGERISMSLLAMAIREQGLDAVSLTGSQSGIITTASHAQARIIEVRPFRVEDELELDRIVIVAGYQGVSYRRDVTTLGRGGSDTTAVALAAALSAEACEIYSDVAGVYDADPRIVANAAKLEAIAYEEMQELAVHGARVLNAQAVEFAKARGIAVYARKTGSADPGTVIRRDVPKAGSGVRGIAHEQALATISTERTGTTAVRRWLEAMEELVAHPKQIIHTETGAFSAVMSLDDVHNEDSVIAATVSILGEGSYRADRGAVSLIGEGITIGSAIAQKSLAAMAAAGMEVFGLSTSSFRVTLLISSADVQEAVRVLHAEMSLGEGHKAEAVIT